jgi:hypothetical protein
MKAFSIRKTTNPN